MNIGRIAYQSIDKGASYQKKTYLEYSIHVFVIESKPDTFH